MAPRYLPRADDGINIQDVLAQAGQDKQNQNLIDLLGVLIKAGDPNTQRVMPPIGDILGEQRQRAEAEAGSMHPDAKYLPGMNPGGLFDSGSSFIGSLGLAGVNAPQLEGSYRLANRVPLDTFGGTEGAMNLANRAASSAAQYETPNKYGDTIDTIVRGLIEKMAPQQAAPAAAASTAPSAGTGDYPAIKPLATKPHTGAIPSFAVANDEPTSVDNTRGLVDSIRDRIRQIAAAGASTTNYGPKLGEVHR